MLSCKHATHRGSRPGSKAFSQFDQLPGRLEITCRRPWAGRRRHSASSRSAPSARSALVSTGSGSHGPTRSRVAHADCATLMESRVVVVARNAAGSFTARRSVACYRSQTSCTRSSAFHRAAQHAVGDAEERGGANEDRSGVIEGSRSFGAGGLIDWHLSRTAALRTGPAPQSAAHRIHIATTSPRPASSEFRFTSADGLRIACARWDSRAPVRGVVQIAHGMGEHIGRYVELIDALISAGLTVYGNDHRGHGHTASSATGFGDFGEGGFDRLVEDMVRLSRIATEENPDRPFHPDGAQHGFLRGATIRARP